MSESFTLDQCMFFTDVENRFFNLLRLEKNSSYTACYVPFQGTRIEYVLPQKKWCTRCSRLSLVRVEVKVCGI